jgi:hypothetical protein
MGLSELRLGKGGGDIRILLDVSQKGETDAMARAAQLLALVNHEMAEAAIYSGMAELSPLEGRSRSDIEALAVALSQRAAESAGLKGLADEGLRIFLKDALAGDLRRVDAQRLALGLLDQVVRETKDGTGRAEMVREVVNLAGMGHSLLEMTGAVVFPKVLTIDARSFFTKGKFNGALWAAVSAPKPEMNVLIVDNLEAGEKTQRKALVSRMKGVGKNVRLAGRGVGVRNGKIYLEDLMKTMPTLFGWHKSVVPMVRVGVATTDADRWKSLVGIIPVLLEANLAAVITNAFKQSRIVDLSA